MAGLTYDVKADTIKGELIMICIGESKTPVAYGKTCTISLSADTVDTSNKMSGNWKEYLSGQLGWTVSCEALVSKATGHMSYNSLKAAMVAREPVLVTIGKVVDGEFSSSMEYESGYATFTKLDKTAENGQITTCSIELQGSGSLDDVAAIAG